MPRVTIPRSVEDLFGVSSGSFCTNYNNQAVAMVLLEVLLYVPVLGSNIFLYYVLPFYYSGLFGWVVIYDLVVYLFH